MLISRSYLLRLDQRESLDDGEKDVPVLELIDSRLPTPVLRKQVRLRPYETRQLPNDERPVVLDPGRRREVAASRNERLESPPFSSSAIKDERDGRDRVEADSFIGSASSGGQRTAG